VRGLRSLALVSLGLLSLCAQTAEVKADPQLLRVGVVQNAMPCSDLTNGQPTGSAVDLWQAIAQQQGWRYSFQPIATPNAAIEAAAAGQVDVAICCLNIIAERLEKADFSVPYQEDSLAFLSRKTNEGILPLLKRIGKEQILRDSILLLFAITMIAAIPLWLISNGFNHKDIDSGRMRNTFFKGWMMLVMGTGIYKMGPDPPTIAIITLVNICRLVVTSVFVGTTATVVFKTNIPSDISQQDSLISALRDGIAVDSGTISELWLTDQVRKLDRPDLLMKIRPISGDKALIESLERGTVGNIMADSGRVRALSRKLQNPDQFQISAKTYNQTPQSFVFGATLNKAKRDQINKQISRMRFEGIIETIIKRWENS
jgi:polar amino acid transport system substrate-binding protein